MAENKLSLWSSATTVRLDPLRPLELGCGKSENVELPLDDHLEANILMIAESDQNFVILVSLDTLYVGPRLRREVLSHFKRKISPRQLVFAASHTHFAPMLDHTKPKLGSVDPEYFAMVRQALIDGIGEVLSKRSPIVELNYGSHRTGNIVSRRRCLPMLSKAWPLLQFRSLFLPSHAPKNATSGKFIEIIGEHGPTALIWSLPCHPVSSSPPERVSSDYIGAVRNAYREERSATRNIPVIFLQGPSAELRPKALGWRNWNTVRGVVLNTLLGKTFVDFEPQSYLRWLGGIVRDFSKRKTHRIVALPTNLSVARCENKLSEIYGQSVSDRLVSCHAIRISDVLLIGVSAEMTSKLAANIESAYFGRSNFIHFTCLDDTFGYATADCEAQAGGYEVNGFEQHFDLNDKATDSLESHFSDLYSQTVEQLQGSVPR